MPLDPSTPLRLVAGEREQVHERVMVHLNSATPHGPMDEKDADAFAEVVSHMLDGLGLVPLEPGEEPMTVGSWKAVLSQVNGWVDVKFAKDLTRIEQEVRRATGE